ncbi:uncharacterized protein ACRADG_012760 [Cochliomyia hominivorax]
MFNFNKFLLICLISINFALLATASGTTEPKIEKKNVAANPAKIAMLTQLKVKDSNDVNGTNTYKCSVGTSGSNLVCNGQEHRSWATQQDIELKVRCPKSGNTSAITYAEIIFSVTTSSVKCFVNEGGIGMGHIGIAVDAWNTMLFDFTTKFYSH